MATLYKHWALLALLISAAAALKIDKIYNGLVFVDCLDSTELSQISGNNLIRLPFKCSNQINQIGSHVLVLLEVPEDKLHYKFPKNVMKVQTTCTEEISLTDTPNVVLPWKCRKMYNNTDAVFDIKIAVDDMSKTTDYGKILEDSQAYAFYTIDQACSTYQCHQKYKDIVEKIKHDARTLGILTITQTVMLHKRTVDETTTYILFVSVSSILGVLILFMFIFKLRNMDTAKWRKRGCCNVWQHNKREEELRNAVAQMMAANEHTEEQSAIGTRTETKTAGYKFVNFTSSKATTEEKDDVYLF